jgi:hypothetical protein
MGWSAMFHSAKKPSLGKQSKKSANNGIGPMVTYETYRSLLPE